MEIFFRILESLPRDPSPRPGEVSSPGSSEIRGLRKTLSSSIITTRHLGNRLLVEGRWNVLCLTRTSEFDPANGAAAGDSPVTVWLRELEAGEQAAAQALYEHFVAQVLALARQRMPAKVRSVYDEDDVAVSAFQSLFRGVLEQRFRFRDRTDIWRLLLTIAERKIALRIRHETRDKRDVRRVAENSIFLPESPGKPSNREESQKSLLAREPTPEFAAEVADTCDALLAVLPDENSRQIALLKLENLTVEEIAAKLGCARRTVQRRLLVIRRAWQEAGGMGTAADDVSQSGDEST